MSLKQIQDITHYTFVSKSTKVPLAKIAALVMTGKLKEIDFKRVDINKLDYFSIKEAVLPFNRFPV